MITATNYFQNFGYISDNSIIIKNLLLRSELKSVDVITKSKVYTPYLIKDGERPESIAEALYGATSYFWIVLFANDINNVYEDWPRTQEIFDSHIIDVYGTLEYAKTTIHHYEDTAGNIGRSNSEYYANNHALISYGYFEIPVYIYDYEMSLNEAKRSINLIRPEYKSQIVKEFQKIFK